MTLIATLAPYKVPMLFGDLLVTGDVTKGRQPVAIPALGDVTEFFGESWGISGLRQKIAIVDPRCAIAWTGMWIGARVAISRLRKAAAESGGLSVEQIFAVLQTTEDLEAFPASFVGWVTSDGRRFCQFQFGPGIEAIDSITLGKVLAGGSGIPAVCELERMFEDAVLTETEGTLSNGDRAVSKGLMLGGLLLQAEHRGGDTASTIRAAFGGGYEIALYVNEKFQKISGITHVIWDAKVEGVGCWLGPRFVLSQAYSGDVLMIRSFSLAEQRGTVGVTNEGAFAIGPMYDTQHRVTSDDLLTMPLDTGHQSHCFVLPTSFYIRVQRWQKPEDRGISFDMIADKLRIGVNHKFMNNIATSLKGGRPQG